MNDLVTIPASWVFGLAAVISALAGIIYASLSSRIAAQEKMIENLQEDIKRMSQGCGHGGCFWKDR